MSMRSICVVPVNKHADASRGDVQPVSANKEKASETTKVKSPTNQQTNKQTQTTPSEKITN